MKQTLLKSLFLISTLVLINVPVFARVGILSKDNSIDLFLFLLILLGASYGALRLIEEKNNGQTKQSYDY